MDCKDCKNKRLCKDLMAEGLEDLTCDDVANIAKVAEDGEQ